MIGTPNNDTDALLAFAIELAEQTGKVIQPYFANANLKVERKADSSPVTVADRAAESFMRERISHYHPEHAIYGEEFGAGGADAASADYRWILDPIDGTKSFISGVPLFTTLIALEYRGVPILGVIHQPTTNETAAGNCHQAWLNGSLIANPQQQAVALEDATLLTTDAREPSLYQSQAKWDALVKRVRLYRSWGDGYGYLKLIAGQADIMCDPILEHWDRAALLPVLKGAGCEFSSWEGGDAWQARSLLATRSGLLGAVLNCLHPDRNSPDTTS